MQRLSLDLRNDRRRCALDRNVQPLVFRTPSDRARRMNVHDDLAGSDVRPASTFACCQIYLHGTDAAAELPKSVQQLRLHEVSRVVGEGESACV
jgi:hypothetical protein